MYPDWNQIAFIECGWQQTHRSHSVGGLKSDSNQILNDLAIVTQIRFHTVLYVTYNTEHMMVTSHLAAADAHWCKKFSNPSDKTSLQPCKNPEVQKIYQLNLLKEPKVKQLCRKMKLFMFVC